MDRDGEDNVVSSIRCSAEKQHPCPIAPSKVVKLTTCSMASLPTLRTSGIISRRKKPFYVFRVAPVTKPRSMSAAIVMSTTYGYDVKPKGDHFVEIAEEAIERMALAILPGAALVNAIPIMKHLPSWFPGAGFQKIASDTKKLTIQMRQDPFKYAKRNMVRYTYAIFFAILRALPCTMYRRLGPILIV
jgi:hypothetical protein